MTRSELSYNLDLIWNTVQANTDDKVKDMDHDSYEYGNTWRSAYAGLVGRLEGVILSLHRHLDEDGLKVLEDELAYALKAVSRTKTEA